MKRFLACCRLLLPLSVALALTGCGSKVQVSGQVILPKGVSLQADDVLQVSLTSVDKPHTEVGVVDPLTRKFTLDAPVPPGKYKVSVACRPYRGQSGSANKKHREELTASFNKFNAGKSTLPEVDIPSGPPVALTVDLDKQTVSP